jgi:hypothetical protein
MDSVNVNGKEYSKVDEMSVDEFSAEAYWTPGSELHIETVTKYFTGVVVLRDETDIYLTKANWIVNTGKFADYIDGEDPTFSEIYVDDAIICVARGGVISVSPRDIVTKTIRVEVTDHERCY